MPKKPKSYISMYSQIGNIFFTSDQDSGVTNIELFKSNTYAKASKLTENIKFDVVDGKASFTKSGYKGKTFTFSRKISYSYSSNIFTVSIWSSSGFSISNKLQFIIDIYIDWCNCLHPPKLYNTGLFGRVYMEKPDFYKILCTSTPEEINEFISSKGKKKMVNAVTFLDEEYIKSQQKNDEVK